MQATTARATPWQARLPFFYGWVIVGVAFLSGYMLSGLTWVVGVLALPMGEELGWSRTAIFGAINVRSYLSVAISPFIGRLYDTPGGPRLLTLVGGVMCGLSTFPIAFMREEWQFFLLYGLLGSIASATLGGQVAGAIVPKWFLRKRGAAMTWATMGQALSVMTVPLLVAALQQTGTWRDVWLVMAAGCLVLVAVPAVLIRRQPEDLGMRPDGVAAPPPGRPAAPQADEVSYTLQQAAATRQFYLLAVGCSAGSLAIIGLPVSVVGMFTAKGLGVDLAVAAVSVFGASSLAGRFFWGYFVSRYPVRSVLVAITVLGALCGPLFFLLEGPQLLAYVVLAGLANGGFFGFNPMLWPLFFGRRHLGAITGATRPPIMLVLGSGAGMMALAFDLTGGYAVGLGIISLSWLLAGGSLLLARPLANPSNPT